MKNKTFKFLVLILFITAFAVVSHVVVIQAEDQVAFEKSWEWKKLGPRLQQAWLEAKKTGDFSRKVECFLIVTSAGSSGDQDILFGAGYYTQVFTGTIARGHTYLKNLPQVAQVGFVREIKLATE